MHSRSLGLTAPLAFSLDYLFLFKDLGFFYKDKQESNNNKGNTNSNIQ